MQIITTKAELERSVQACKMNGQTIGLVPTMGALHAGHASLVRRCVSENDVAEEMNEPFRFDFGGLDTMMDGAMRPGHFNGVVQIVSRLFYLVRPNRAYFGEKDFQQLAIIHYMVERSAMAGTFGALQIIDCPIVREESGLALSSRNERLSAAEKQTALAISRTLFASIEWAKQPNSTVQEVQQRVIDTINSVDGLEVEYYQIVDQTTLLPASTFHHAIGCVTVYCGAVRLIDNIKY